MEKENSSEQPSHIGKRILFIEVFANRNIGKYQRYIKAISPVIEEFNALGLSPLTDDRMRMFSTGNYSFYINEFKEKVNAEMNSVSLFLRPGFKAQTEKHVENITAALDKIRHLTRAYDDQTDCPIVDGLPTLTNEFIEQIKDRHSTKIKSEEGSKFYDAFLSAQNSLKAIVDLGLNPCDYVDLNADTGLDLIGFIE